MNRSHVLAPSLFLVPSRRPFPLIVLAALAVVSVVVFGKLIASMPAVSAWDSATSHSLNLLHTGAIGVISSAFYTVFEPPLAIALVIIVSAVIWLVTRNITLGLSFGAVIAITWLPIVVVKYLVHRARPSSSMLAHPFAVQPDASYPSGHVAFVTALVVVLVMLARGRRLRWLVAVIGSLLVAVLALALVIDGVHFSTDTIASIVWSAALAPLVLFLWARYAIPVMKRISARKV